MAIGDLEHCYCGEPSSPGLHFNSGGKPCQPIYDGPLNDTSVANMSYADAFTAAPGTIWNMPTEHELVRPWRQIVLTLVDRRRGSEFTSRAMYTGNMAAMAAAAYKRNERAIESLPTQGEYLT
jgi:hypothetical protein